MFEKPFIIADVGSNHRGSLDLALRQIESAKECGANAVKFQLYTHEELYGLTPTASLMREYEMPRDWVVHLKHKADDVGIEFMCSAFSVEGYKFIDQFVKIHKVASSEMLHVPILDEIKKTGKPVIISTGGAHWAELAGDLASENRWTLWGHMSGHPTTLLECVANYPAEAHHYNIRLVMDSDSHAAHFKGISDHTLSGDVSLIAARMGATVFERHFDVLRDGNTDPSGPGWVPTTPDRPVSVDRKAMAAWVKAIHQAHALPKDQVKRPEFQHDALLRYRRRPIVTRDMKAGEKLVYDENYGLYRSLVEDRRGAPAQEYLNFNGKTLKVDMKAGQALWYKDLVE